MLADLQPRTFCGLLGCIDAHSLVVDQTRTGSPRYAFDISRRIERTEEANLPRGFELYTSFFPKTPPYWITSFCSGFILASYPLLISSCIIYETYSKHFRVWKTLRTERDSREAYFSVLPSYMAASTFSIRTE